MWQKHKIIISVLQIVILTGLILVRFYVGFVSEYLNHFLEGLIVITLLAFGENIAISLMAYPFMISAYVKSLPSRYFRNKNKPKNQSEGNRNSKNPKPEFSDLLTLEKLN